MDTISKTARSRNMAAIKNKNTKPVFVHGCFWHQHPDCKYASIPKSNQEYWLSKLEKNKRRDQDKFINTRNGLQSLGYLGISSF